MSGEAEGADQALATIDGIDPDVVVLDALMPVVRLRGRSADPRAAAGPEDPALQRGGRRRVCDRAERLWITACLSKDDLEAIPRVALEVARSQRPALP